MIVTTADTHVIGPRKREAPPPGAGAVEDSSLDGAAQSAARRATLSGDTSPGAAQSAARRATLSGDTSPEAHMRRAASILNGEIAQHHTAASTINFHELATKPGGV